jgi:antitoxin component HigA of HigAB toxin-antitoxin module
MHRLGEKMDIRPLHTDDDYRAALAEVSALVDQDPKPGTPECDRLEILSIFVEHYEVSMVTAHLLRSPANAAHLECSIAQLGEAAVISAHRPHFMKPTQTARLEIIETVV